MTSLKKAEKMEKISGIKEAPGCILEDVGFSISHIQAVYLSEPTPDGDYIIPDVKRKDELWECQDCKKWIHQDNPPEVIRLGMGGCYSYRYICKGCVRK